MQSKLILYSRGIVLEDKEEDDDLLWVQPTEVLTDVPGDLSSFKESSGDIESSNRIAAIWMPLGDMRDSAPDLVTGEKVLIYRYADTEVYFWVSIGRSNDLRKLEHILFVISNTEETAEAPTPNNQLFITASTKEGYLEIITPGNRDEEAIYHVKLDFKNGIFSMKDNQSNSFRLDSPGRHVDVKTNTMTYDISHMLIKGSVKMEKTLLVLGATTIKNTLQVLKNITASAAITAANGISTLNGSSMTSSGNLNARNISLSGVINAVRGVFQNGPHT